MMDSSKVYEIAAKMHADDVETNESETKANVEETKVETAEQTTADVPKNDDKIADANTPKEEVKDENKEKKTVVIEVKQDKYFIGEVEKSLADIEAMLTGEEVANTSFVLESNYAATKEWDEIKALFTQYEVDVAEQ